MQVPEQVRAAAAGILRNQMAAGLEQAAALDRKQRRAADRQLDAELISLEPGVRGGHGSRGLPGWGQRGRLPRVEGAFTRANHGGAVGIASPADDL